MKKRITAITAAVLLAALLSLAVSSDNNVYSPESDPLVTKSYVDSKLAGFSLSQEETEQIKNEIKTSISASLSADLKNQIAASLKDELYEKLKTEFADSLQANTAKLPFDIVCLSKGQKIMSAGSAELIVRSGSASVIAGENGLSDITLGKDITNGANVALNHYIIIPRNDGRGISATADSTYVMVRGEYEIQ